MEKLTFATYAEQPQDFRANHLMVQTLRTFGGENAGQPVYIYYPAALAAQARAAAHNFDALDVHLRPCHSTLAQDFPYAFKVAAAAEAEREIATGTIAWMDRHTLVTGPCTALPLQDAEQFAYRPVHMRLLGSLCDTTPDVLWSTLCDVTGLSPASLFAMQTVVDRAKIRAYFFAGHFSFKAEAGLMQEWLRMFALLQGHARMRLMFMDEMVQPMLHQLALVPAVLTRCSGNALRQLPDSYAYPIQLHSDILAPYRAKSLASLDVAFYHGVFPPPKMPMPEALSSWIQKALASYQ